MANTITVYIVLTFQWNSCTFPSLTSHIMLIKCSCFSLFQSMFFFLAQTEQGDIFKITLEMDEDMVSEFQ